MPYAIPLLPLEPLRFTFMKNALLAILLLTPLLDKSVLCQGRPDEVFEDEAFTAVFGQGEEGSPWKRFMP